MVDTSNFVTRGEFEEVMKRLKNYLITPSIEKTESPTDNVQAKSAPEQRSFDF